MSAEIPGQVSQREIAEANEMVIAERDSLLTKKRRLEQQLAAALERERLLQMDSECLRIAAEKLGCDKSDVVRTIENNQDRENELLAWKESMLSVMPPMQEIGQEIGVELGDTIHDKILPWIKASKERERELREFVGLIAAMPCMMPIKQATQERLKKVEAMR